MIEGKPTPERRRGARVPVALSAVVTPSCGRPFACVVENLSAGGALLRTQGSVAADGPVRVRLQVSPRRAVYITGSVVRRHPGSDGTHRFAVAFADVPPSVEDLVQAAALRALLAQRSAVQVLVVDDEEVIRSSLARELRGIGAVAREACGNVDAIVQLQVVERTFDVAIVDAHLDGDDGRELLRLLQDEHPEVRRVLMSGHLTSVDFTHAELSGLAHQVITKPWRQADLERALGQAR